jgi:peptide/nickel transport system substrate-binding protein
LVTAACSGEKKAPPRPTHPPRTNATLRLGYAQEPATLDPIGAGGGSSATRDILRPLLPSLFSLDANLHPKPELAAGWPRGGEIRFDPFTVVVRMRAATWSDGKPITSTDVRFSWEKLRGGPTGYRYRYLHDVKVVDARTFELHFDRVVRRWWALFSVDDMVLPAHAFSDAWNRAPTVSGGPFRFEEWTQGLRVRMTRNESYWGPAAPLAGIDVVFVPDDETRLQLLQRGELDAMFSEGDSNIGRRARAHGFAPRAGALAGEGGASGAFGPTWWELDLQPDRLTAPVAHAVVEAVHPTLVAEMLEDSARPLNGLPPDFTTPDTFNPWKGRGSLAEATALLEQGRVPGGSVRFEFQLVFPKIGAASSIAAFVHFRLREIGITAELVGLEPASFEKTWVPQRKADAVLRLRRGSDAPDAGSYASSSRLPGGAGVDDQVTDAETKVDAQRLRSGPVIGLAREPWTSVERGLVGAASVAPLARTRTWIVARSGVAGPQATGAANGPLWNAGVWTAAA